MGRVLGLTESPTARRKSLYNRIERAVSLLKILARKHTNVEVMRLLFNVIDELSQATTALRVEAGRQAIQIGAAKGSSKVLAVKDLQKAIAQTTPLLHTGRLDPGYLDDLLWDIQNTLDEYRLLLSKPAELPDFVEERK